MVPKNALKTQAKANKHETELKEVGQLRTNRSFFSVQIETELNAMLLNELNNVQFQMNKAVPFIPC